LIGPDEGLLFTGASGQSYWWAGVSRSAWSAPNQMKKSRWAAAGSSEVWMEVVDQPSLATGLGKAVAAEVAADGVVAGSGGVVVAE
jgi:hypothetical protein